MGNMQMEVFAFQVKNNHLLSIVIDTFYSNMEIIPKDLISNASDVCGLTIFIASLLLLVFFFKDALLVSFS
jgi:hypothetical protein